MGAVRVPREGNLGLRESRPHLFRTSCFTPGSLTCTHGHDKTKLANVTSMAMKGSECLAAHFTSVRNGSMDLFCTVTPVPPTSR
jgi:hypothetical protein